MNPSSTKSKAIASYVDRLPPCNAACPAGENIQKWLGLVKEQKLRMAWETIMQNNPLPAVHGRVCYHYCESKCNRLQYDETVAIHCVERFLGDMAITENWSPPISPIVGKKVLIVGAGPAGLSAAYHLRLLGHKVTIYETLPQPGGMMLVGIPAYRLPREILLAEVERILNMEVEIVYGHKVEDVVAVKEQGNFAAVFLAIGAHIGRNITLSVTDPCPMFSAVDYLRDIALGQVPRFGSRLVIYGGGNTAIDVARSAKRLGVSDISIVYHRTREKMSAFSHEIADALAEGIKFIYLRTIVSLNGNNLSLSINELDEAGKPRPTGKLENLITDALIFAVNQATDSEFLRKVMAVELQANGSVMVDECFMTGQPGIFAGGDMLPYDRSVTIAVGHGKKAAYHIDAYLRGTSFTKSPHHEIATFAKLHISEAKSAKAEQQELAVAERLKSFVEVMQDCSAAEVLSEAKRCFSCGNCFECDICYNICPVNAITKLGLGKRYKIDQDKCIGCAKCYKSCPCGAIIMAKR